ncbi:MAG TPA: HAD family phosphatase [Parachlamydiaceae bacterium]|nr:HAD family phosphatase [Parachlamydiaceae bacterium]
MNDMHWIHQFKLFLFDFDGLLVNTEELHFLAYKIMCENRGFHLDWSFERYCQSAHYSADILGKELYEKFPLLYKMESSWDVLYQEKKEIIVNLLKMGQAKLMPGVKELLEALEKADINRVVVTHSPLELVEAARQHNPVLHTIPHWITRHDYTQPKPNSECYLKAISLFGQEGEAIIGFEDTPRGMRALLGTRANPVLVCTADYPEIPEFIKKGVKHFTSFKEINDDDF